MYFTQKSWAYLTILDRCIYCRIVLESFAVLEPFISVRQSLKLYSEYKETDDFFSIALVLLFTCILKNAIITATSKQNKKEIL